MRYRERERGRVGEGERECVCVCVRARVCVSVCVCVCVHAYVSCWVRGTGAVCASNTVRMLHQGLLRHTTIHVRIKYSENDRVRPQSHAGGRTFVGCTKGCHVTQQFIHTSNAVFVHRVVQAVDRMG